MIWCHQYMPELTLIWSTGEQNKSYTKSYTYVLSRLSLPLACKTYDVQRDGAPLMVVRAAYDGI
jgi:hypothetical protein